MLSPVMQFKRLLFWQNSFRLAIVLSLFKFKLKDTLERLFCQDHEMVRAIGGHVMSAMDFDKLNPEARTEALSIVGEMSMPQIVATMSSKGPFTYHVGENFVLPRTSSTCHFHTHATCQ